MPPPEARGRMWIAVPLALAVACTLVNLVWTALSEPGETTFAIDRVYDATFLFAGLSCLARARIAPAVRGTWIAFALGLFAWGAADVYWTLAFGDAARIPYPSLADLGYILAPISFFVGIALLNRSRTGRVGASSFLDAAVGGLGAAALGTAILAPALVGLSKGDTAAVVTNVAYPLTDLALLAMIGATVVLGHRESARSLLLIGLGMLVWAGADVTYLFQEATSSYVPGWIDALWQFGALAVAAGALVGRREEATSEVPSRLTLAVPALFTTFAVGVLIWDHYERLRGISVWLAGATLLLVAARLAMSFRENDRLVRALHDDSVTDVLTGLGNRRRLYRDLEESIGETRTRVFALFDLDGFKAYNDTFGHPAGDALLRRLGHSLSDAVEPHGSAYRLGGDEFCVLVATGTRRPEAVFEAARASLHEEGEGFSIGASGGWVRLPAPRGEVEEILRDADRAMYEDKAYRSRSSERQTQDVLMRVFREREPALGDHSEGVARLAVEMGRRLRLDAESRDVLARAAELHDVGKIAIPDEVLHKPGPLDESEWELMRRHTLIGDRILGATPALRPVARLVRSSHERWDGRGYPDGLAGEETPLGARIICICDSFDAMTSHRPYQGAVSRSEALTELRRCAGSQFDPELVEEFCSMLEEGPLDVAAAEDASAAGRR